MSLQTSDIILEVVGFPSFRLYKSGDRGREELDYSGPRDVENFITFVKMGNEAERKDEL